MTELTKIACPSCHTLNQVPSERLADGPRCGLCKDRLFLGQPVNLDQLTFDQHVSKSDIPVLVDFWAPWCGPCKVMAPILGQITRSLEPRVQVAKVDTEQEQVLAARYSIRSIPSLALFSGGREIARQAGVMDGPALQRWVGEAIAS